MAKRLSKHAKMHVKIANCLLPLDLRQIKLVGIGWNWWESVGIGGDLWKPGKIGKLVHELHEVHELVHRLHGLHGLHR